METPVQNPLPAYAGFGRRLVASWIDTFIIWLVGILIQTSLGFGIFEVFSLKSLEEFEKLKATTHSSLISLLLIALTFGYYILFWTQKEGATPGKAIMGIKITRDNGDKMTTGASFMRIIGILVNSFTFLFFGIGFLWMLWDKKKQTLHDKIAGTIVVQSDKKPRLVLGTLIAIGGLIIMIGLFAALVVKGFMLGYESSSMRQANTQARMQKNQQQTQEQYADKILSFAPSACGLSVAVPKTVEKTDKANRKWLYEEVPLDPSNFFVLDSDVFTVTSLTGAFLGFKDADARLGGASFKVGYPGLNIYCAPNTKSLTLAEYTALALTNKKYTVKTRDTLYAGTVELQPITMTSAKEEEKGYLAVSADGKMLIYLRIWGAEDTDPVKDSLESDINIIMSSLKYREGRPAAPRANEEEPVVKGAAIRPFVTEWLNATKQQSTVKSLR